jgi:hypothetical protein
MLAAQTMIKTAGVRKVFDDFRSDDILATSIFVSKLIAVFVGIIWIALAALTWRDIRQRTRQPAAIAAAVLLVAAGFVPGYWIYLLVRPGSTVEQREEDALRRRILLDYAPASFCHTCHKGIREDYAVCPYCSSPVQTNCEQCGHRHGGEQEALSAEPSTSGFVGSGNAIPA